MVSRSKTHFVKSERMSSEFLTLHPVAFGSKRGGNSFGSGAGLAAQSTAAAFCLSTAACIPPPPYPHLQHKGMQKSYANLARNPSNDPPGIPPQREDESPSYSFIRAESEGMRASEEESSNQPPPAWSSRYHGNVLTSYGPTTLHEPHRQRSFTLIRGDGVSRFLTALRSTRIF